MSPTRHSSEPAPDQGGSGAVAHELLLMEWTLVGALIIPIG
jgi:hypothetical protein